MQRNGYILKPNVTQFTNIKLQVMPFLKMKHWPFGIIGFDSLKDSDSTNNTGVFFWGQYGDTVWIQSMQLDRTGPQNSGKI